MEQLEIGALFDDTRFPGGIKTLFMMLYAPIGVLLLLLRIFIGFHTFLVSCLIPKTFPYRGLILRTMCAVLGIVVSTEGMERRKKNAKVLVANTISSLDHLAVDLVIPNVFPCVWNLPPFLMWLLAYKDMGAAQGRDVLIRNASNHIKGSPVPLLSFPEGASTNGKRGVLKFSVWPFSLDEPVQPLAIRASRPFFAQSALSVLGGQWWADILWFLFTPYTVFSIKVLPMVEEQEEETVEEFTKRTQQLIADSLQLHATPHTSQDKVEHMKRRLAGAGAGGSRAGSSSSSQGGSAMEVMVYQVKEVLPHVPPHVIRADLVMTKDVDLTITNLLEGRVDYTAENAGVEAAPATPTPTPTHPTAPSSATAKAAMIPSPFSKNPDLRTASLQDRKKALLEYARQKYMQKHGMLG